MATKKKPARHDDADRPSAHRFLLAHNGREIPVTMQQEHEVTQGQVDEIATHIARIEALPVCVAAPKRTYYK